MLQADELVGAWRNSPVATVPPSEVVLVTDFDGTLADIVPDPTQTFARPESLQALSRLVRLLADVIVLSSRTHDQLDALVPISGVRLIGDSGLAIPRHAHREALDNFNADVAVLLERTPGAWLEVKPASSAVHFRNTSLGGDEMLALIQPLIYERPLAAYLGRKVIELHAPKAGKGSALAALLPGEDPAGVVCCGDDENDRSMFEYVSSLDIPHMCVGVSSPEAPAHLFDHCDLVVSGPSEAAVLLNEIVEWAETASSMAQ
ncbi:MAG TPA: trehalose-phosphatase [Candidatus Dormibacteraeota bacterium]|nr:trehalose-phosphatase [Candidatus Dormibacteraeota bacterium]